MEGGKRRVVCWKWLESLKEKGKGGRQQAAYKRQNAKGKKCGNGWIGRQEGAGGTWKMVRGKGWIGRREGREGTWQVVSGK